MKIIEFIKEIAYQMLQMCNDHEGINSDAPLFSISNFCILVTSAEKEESNQINFMFLELCNIIISK